MPHAEASLSRSSLSRAWMLPIRCGQSSTAQAPKLRCFCRLILLPTGRFATNPQLTGLGMPCSWCGQGRLAGCCLCCAEPATWIQLRRRTLMSSARCPMPTFGCVGPICTALQTSDICMAHLGPAAPFQAGWSSSTCHSPSCSCLTGFLWPSCIKRCLVVHFWPAQPPVHVSCTPWQQTLV